MHAHILAKYMHYMHTVILFENVLSAGRNL